jgi:hypothetical protein
MTFPHIDKFDLTTFDGGASPELSKTSPTFAQTRPTGEVAPNAERGTFRNPFSMWYARAGDLKMTPA